MVYSDYRYFICISGIQCFFKYGVFTEEFIMSQNITKHLWYSQQQGIEWMYQTASRFYKL